MHIDFDALLGEFESVSCLWSVYITSSDLCSSCMCTLKAGLLVQGAELVQFLAVEKQ